MIDTLLRFFSRYTDHPDKVLHFLVGLVIALAVWWATGSAGAALAATIITGVGKEWYDSRHPGHTVELLDALATIAPGVLLWLIVAPDMLPAWTVGGAIAG
jgi:hypothetical protein